MQTRRRKFSEEVLEAIPKWVASGATADDIAALLGTTVGSLRVTCSIRDISLKQKRGTFPPSLHSHLRRALSTEAWVGLCAEAERRGVPPVNLAFMLLEIVSVEDLYVAVIADEDDDVKSIGSKMVKKGKNGR